MIEQCLGTSLAVSENLVLLAGRERFEYQRRKCNEYFRLRDEWRDLFSRGRGTEEMRFIANMVKKDVLRTDRAHKVTSGFVRSLPGTLEDRQLRCIHTSRLMQVNALSIGNLESQQVSRKTIFIRTTEDVCVI